MRIARDSSGNAVDLDMIMPDDWHLHIRQGKTMVSVLPFTTQRFARAIIMPNLLPPVTTVQQAEEYHKDITALISADSWFQPLMTLYLTDNTSLEEVWLAKTSGIVFAMKLYPKGATTNSNSGVTNIRRIYPVLAEMEKVGLVLCVHGEVTDPAIDIFDREALFIETTLTQIVKDFPGLKIVFEHATTKTAVEFVLAQEVNVAATITPQHLRLNRNDLLAGGIRPHHYCLPVLKREEHRLALVNAATSGSPNIFLGTDSAPHDKSTKESACGCAGCFSSPTSLEVYAEVFETVGCLDRLEGFASIHGPMFYGLPVNDKKIRMKKESWKVPEWYYLHGNGFPYGSRVVPLLAGETLSWKMG